MNVQLLPFRGRGKPVLIHQINQSRHINGSQIQFSFIYTLKYITADTVNIEITLLTEIQAGNRSFIYI